jgi:hypothetical protein
MPGRFSGPKKAVANNLRAERVHGEPVTVLQNDGYVRAWIGLRPDWRSVQGTARGGQ